MDSQITMKILDNEYVIKHHLARKVASWLFTQACTESSEGNWMMYFSEVEEYWGITQAHIMELSELILECLRKDFRVQIAEVEYIVERNDEGEIDDDMSGFDITLYTDYCCITSDCTFTEEEIKDKEDEFLEEHDREWKEIYKKVEAIDIAVYEVEKERQNAAGFAAVPGQHYKDEWAREEQKFANTIHTLNELRKEIL